MATNPASDRSSGPPTQHGAGFAITLADGLLLRIRRGGGWDIFAPGTTEKASDDFWATYVLSGPGKPMQEHLDRARELWRRCVSTAAELTDAFGIPPEGPVLWIYHDWHGDGFSREEEGPFGYVFSFHPPGSTGEAIACGAAQRVHWGLGLPTRDDYDRAAKRWHVITLTGHVEQSGKVRVHRPQDGPLGDVSIWWRHNARFVRGYIAGMFLTRDRLYRANPTYKNPSHRYQDIAGETLDEITADCERFLAARGSPNDSDTVDEGLAFWRERRRGAWSDAGFPPVAACLDNNGKVRLREIGPARTFRFETSTVNVGKDRLVLCIRPRGWTLHAPGTSAEAIAAAKASCIVSGRGRPTQADRERAQEVWREQVLTAHLDTKDAMRFQSGGPWFMGIFGQNIVTIHWRELPPFVRGYIAAMFGSALHCDDTTRGVTRARTFRYLLGLYAIRADCERFLSERVDPDARNTLECGIDFWNQRSRGLWRERGFPPVTAYVSPRGVGQRAISDGSTPGLRGAEVVAFFRESFGRNMPKRARADVSEKNGQNFLSSSL